MLEYFETNAEDDAASSMEVAAEFWVQALVDARYWKWFVLAFHSAMQGTFALALKGTAGFLVQKPGVMKRMLQEHRDGGDHVEQRMDNFVRLYKKIQCGENLAWSNSRPFTARPAHDQAVDSLDALRDGFTHFNIKSWQIEVELIRERSEISLQIADFVVNESNAISWRNPIHSERIQCAIAKLGAELAKA